MLDPYIIVSPNQSMSDQSLRVQTYDEYYKFPHGLFEPIAGAKTEEEAMALLKHMQSIGVSAYFDEVVAAAMAKSSS